jgi:prepilin-type N-terminal cleavage/methylation domain-containing protein
MPVTRALAREHGWTLIELLLAMTLMLIILSAVLTSFEGFANNSRRNNLLQDQMDQTRGAVDQIVRQTRNLANPTTGAAGQTPTTIAVADWDKVIFQTTDPQKQWVSYCLDSSSPRGAIYYQTSAVTGLTPAVVADATTSPAGMAAGCPSTNSNWQRTVKVADYVTNRVGTRPLFAYYTTTGTTALTTPVSQNITSTITRVRTSVFLDIDPNKPPAEVQLASAAYMRNQNQSPRGLFTAKAGTGGAYTFDAGESSDPEGRTLIYDWYSAPTTTTALPSPAALPSCLADSPSFPTAPAAGSDWSCIGNDVVLAHDFDLASLPRYVFLRVTDPGNLQALSSMTANSCLTVVDPARTQDQCMKVT